MARIGVSSELSLIQANAVSNASLSVSFIVPTLNEKLRIGKALESIMSQDYPEPVEVILADGGSVDGTIEIAKRYGCRILQDPTKLPEARMFAAFRQAHGEICIFMDADNCLRGNDWLNKMLKPFEDPQVQAVTTHPVSEKDEFFLNRYLNNLPSDPLTFFVHGYHEDLREMKRVYSVEKETDDYVLFRFDPINYPIIAMHQGFALRKTSHESSSNMEDDILPIIEMIEKNQKIAYVPKAGIRHLSISNMRDFFNKYRRRTLVGLTGNNSFKKRLNQLPRDKRLRTYLSPIYFMSFILPVGTGVKRFIQTRDPVMLIHPFVCGLFLLAVISGLFDYLLQPDRVRKQRLLTTK
jgi:glycosyltransferase involved in cell wall biosynthesis